MTTLTKRVAAAMEAKRAELINQPLARIWEELATVAIATASEEITDEAYQRGSRDTFDATRWTD
jgi:hypothetical protein